MIYSELPFDSNRKLSKLALGTVQFGSKYGFTEAKSQAEVDEILSVCTQNGINLIDTGREYGDSEDKIKRFATNHPESDFFFATKLQMISEEVASDDAKLYQKVIDSINASQRMLRVSTINLLQLHQCDSFLIDNKTFWETINEAKDDHLFEFFGVSVYEPEEAEKLLSNHSDQIDFLQIPFSVFDQRFSNLFSLFSEKNIAVISRSAFLKGIIPIEQSKLPQELASIESYKEKLEQLANQIGLTVAEVALLFALRTKEIHSTIIGVDSANELTANVNTIQHLSRLDTIEEELKNLAISEKILIDPRQWKSL